jgi:hypothetical protein
MNTLAIALLCHAAVHETAPPLALSIAPQEVTADGGLAADAVADDTGALGLRATLALHHVSTLDSPDGNEDLATRLTDALFAFEGRWYGWDTSIALDFDEASGSTLDRAWLQRNLDARHAVRIGLVRVPFLWSAFADEGEFVFPLRSRLGREFALSDEGMELLADYRVVDLRVALTNGGDDTSDARRGTARLGVHLVGERPLAGERPHGPDGLSVFLAYTDEGTLPQGDAFAAEIHGQAGAQRVHLEWLDAAEGLGDQRGITGTWAFALDGGESEVGLRLEHLREPVRRTAIGLGYGRSFLANAVRGQIAAEYVMADGSALDGFAFSAGLVIAL